MPTSTTDQKTRAVIVLLITMLIWGSSSVVLRSMAVALAPENSLALRYVVLVIILVPALVYTGGWRIARADWPRLLIVSGFGMMGYNWFVNEGFARVAAGLGTVVTMVEPIIIALLAWAFLRERLSVSIFVGLAISILGGLVLFWPDLMQVAVSPVDPWGIFCLMVACTGWAVYTIGAKPLLAKYKGFDITALTFLISAPPFILLASAPLPQLFANLTTGQWGELMILAVLNALLGTFLWNYGTRHLSGAIVGSFLYLIPVIAVVCGYFFLAEPITFNLVSGGLIMLAGVAFAQYGPGLFGRKDVHAR